MLESYQKEVEKRRRERRGFWIITFIASVFLYLFFHGYYPYVRIDFASYLGNTHRPPESVQVVRPFGIINIRSVPAPDSITINGEPFTNGEKKIRDFGAYSIDLKKSGYIGFSTEVLLDKKNPFHIEALELIKNPTYRPFGISVSDASILPSGKILLAATGATTQKISTGTTVAGKSKKVPAGNLYYLVNEDWKDAFSFRTTAAHIGGEYFSSGGVIASIDEGTKQLRSIPAKSGTGYVICKSPRIISSDVFCDDTKTFITGDHVDMKSKILSVGEKLMKTADGLITSYTGKSFRIDSGSGTTPDVEDIVRISWVDYLLSHGELMTDMSADATVFSVPEISSVGKTFTFGKETFLLGYSGSTAMFTLIDERENRFIGKIGDVKLSDITIEPLASGYIILTRENAFFYQKGADSLVRLIDGHILGGVTNDSILFSKNGSTYLMPIGYGNE